MPIRQRGGIYGFLDAATGGIAATTLDDGAMRNIAIAKIVELVTSNRSFTPEGVGGDGYGQADGGPKRVSSRWALRGHSGIRC